MKIIDTTFERLPRERLEIGFEGENQRATVRVDCASVFAEYPNATPALIVKPLFADAYPVVVDRNGTDVDWLITSEILSFSGDGEIQLVFYKDEVICKSAVSKIRVCRSLQVTGEMPDPVVQWIENANRKLAEVDAALVSIDEMDATAHGLPEGAEPTVEVSTVDDHKRLSFGIPAGATGAKGDKGDKGDRGEVGATPQMGIGTVQTLPAGSAATASMSGTAENPLLNLGIPKGDRGEKGDQGEKGDTGATGATGATPDFSIGAVSTLPAGSSATAEITGTAENPVLSLGIPQGAQGEKGDKGDKGDPGEGVPTGGITGQVLAKATDTDYDTEWIHVAPVIKNEASGAIASFPDGAEMPVDEVTAQINPVQDLHGYENPWPGGGGKNLADTRNRDVSIAGVRFVSDADGVISISGTRDSSTGWKPFVSFTNFAPGNYVFSTNSTHLTCLVNWTHNSSVFTVAEGDVVRIALYNISAGDVINETGIKVQIESGSTATDWTPFSNICPITGWTGAKVTRTGKNLFDPTIYNGGVYNPTVGSVWNLTESATQFTQDGDTYSLTISASWNYYTLLFEIPNTAQNYWRSVTFTSSATGGTTEAYLDENFTVLWKTNSTDSTQVKSGLLVIPSGAKYYALLITNRSTASATLSLTAPQIELGSTATAYEPYQGETYEVEFPSEAGTVYGGSLTIAEDGSGVLTVDRASVTYDGDETFGDYAIGSDNYCVVTYPQNKAVGYKKSICDRLPNVDAAFSKTEYGIYGDHPTLINTYFRMPNPNITTKAEFLEWLAENPLHLVYELATPITYTLTAPEITTLLGENNLWHDANGEISVGYKADTKLYIDNKIAELVAQIVNS